MSTKLLPFQMDPGVLLVAHTVGGELSADYVSGDTWTAILTDSGTATKSDVAGGYVALACSDGTVADNDEAYLKTSAETMLFAANKPIEFYGRVQFSEAATDAANVIVGVANAVAANYLQDNGAGPPANYYGFNIHKVDGGTKWICESSVGTTQYTTVSTTVAGGSSFHSCRIVFRPDSPDTATVSFEIDTDGGANFTPLVDANGNAIVHRLTTLGTPTEMQIGIGAKNGGATMETLNVSVGVARQLR